MKVIPETEEDIVTIITTEFRSFGGARDPDNNPIAHALRGQPPQFAAGVDIAADLDKQRNDAMATCKAVRS